MSEESLAATGTVRPQSTPKQPQTYFGERNLKLRFRAVNALGGLANKLGVPRPRIDPEYLMRRAERVTGLSDWGSPAIERRLERIYRTVGDDRNVSFIGRLIGQRVLLSRLINRLEVIDTVTRQPEITDLELEMPTIIVGFARSGTSLLYRLLALHPKFRAPQTWELMRPCRHCGWRRWCPP